MSGDSVGRPAVPPPTPAAAPRGTCAIAPVRGDVTTVRAAEAVRARRLARARAVERSPAGPVAEAFPAHLMRVGPA